MTTKLPLALALTLLVACAGASTAQAGSAFQISTASQDPDVLVDPASGLAHVVWADSPNTQSIRYCQVPRGATACTNPRTLLVDDLDPIKTADQPHLLRDSATGTLYVVVKRYVGNDAFLFKSTDGGATWTTKTKIYDNGSGTDNTAPVLGPAAGKVTIGSWNSGMYAFSAKLDGTDAALTTKATLPSAPVSSLVYNFTVALTGDGGLIATADNLDKTYAWRLAPGADPSVTGNWSPAPTLVGDGADARLAGGPSGAYSLNVFNPLSQQVFVRKWQSGTTFGSGVLVATESAREPGITVGPSGAVAAFWRGSSNPNYPMRASFSTDGGATFAAPYTFSDDPDLAIAPRVSLAQDNQGVAVWESAGRTIKASSLVPLPTPTPTPSGPTPSTPTPTPTTRNVLATVPGASITFGVPGGCVQPGSTFKVTLKWKRKKKKGNKFVKVTRADFYVGSKVVKKDKKAPFVQTLKVTASAKRGSTISLRARAYIKVKSGKAPKKSIKASIKVCP